MVSIFSPKIPTSAGSLSFGNGKPFETALGKDVFMSCGGGGAKAAKEAETVSWEGDQPWMLPRKPPEKW